jgi:thiol-disulfide isomerase/thioredoxin/mono/diheme cytochrome c family protein
MKWFTVALMVGLSMFAPAAEAPKPVAPQQAGVGRQITDFTAKDLAGTTFSLSSLAQSHKAVVVAITSTSCPISKKYLPTLQKLEAEFAPLGVVFVYINPLATDDLTSVMGLEGHYIHDVNEVLVSRLGATSTADVFVLDAQRTLVYHGAVDDQYGLGYNLPAAKKTYLRDALTSHLKREPVRIAATTAPGCALDLKPAPTKTTVTYHERISRVLQQACVECHRDGGVAPFRLDRLEDVVAHKGMIRKVVDAGTMPPWSAVHEPGKWANDRSLTATDKADLLAWLKNGTPAGDAAQAPMPRTYSNDWAIGKPDLIVSLPKPVNISATGTMPYQNVVVETKLPQDQWVSAVEIRPTDRAVVHHVLVFVVGEGETPMNSRELAARFRERVDERKGSFAAYVPGNASQIFPAGFAKKLSKGAKLRFQIHYTPNGTATKDQLQLGLKFAKEPPEHELKVTAVMQPRISIPAHDAKHKEVAELKVPADAMLMSFMPHMHVRGKACKYELISADKKTTTTLLDIPHYDFNWQLKYELAQPLEVPAKSTIRFTVWYDNSDKNPANPDPTKTVVWGPQTYEEMMLGYLEYHLVGAKK